MTYNLFGGTLNLTQPNPNTATRLLTGAIYCARRHHGRSQNFFQGWEIQNWRPF